MENLKKQFVTFNIANMLKSIGFSEPCYSVYSFESKKLISLGYYEIRNGQLLAPTYSQACDWIRENHNLIVEEKWINLQESAASVFKCNNKEKELIETFSNIKNALEYTLINLIK